MQLKHYYLLIAFLLTFQTAFSQYAEDALRFSQTEQGATARFRAIGNAQTALGGDLSSLSGNPAGLGMFTRSEANISLDYNNTSLNGLYLDKTSNTQLDKLSIPQAAIVWRNRSRRPAGNNLEKGWLNFNFGLSYNRTNNLNGTIDYRGTNNKSSFADYLADIATSKYINRGEPTSTNDVFPGKDLESMSYDGYLITYDPSGYISTTGLGNNQRNTDHRSGSQSELNFGFGANYSNKFYIGASIGISYLDYTSDREYKESGFTRRAGEYPAGNTFPTQNPIYLDTPYDLSFRSNQKTTGSGVNAKLGFIYKATDNVRLGVNFISPTWYTVDDNYSEVLDSAFPAIEPVKYYNDEVHYPADYTLRTPYRLNGGISVVFNKMGLISGDVEYVDYTAIHFSTKDIDTEQFTNEDIRSFYQSAVNFRIGGEYKLDNISLRAGYNTQGNPYKNADFSNSTVSGGLGYRGNSFYIDLTYTNTQTKYNTRPYLISESSPDFPDTGAGEVANIKNTRNGVFLTVGKRF